MFYCTYFDVNYLPRGLALYYSLRKHCKVFKLFILCMDEQSYSLVSALNLGGVELIPLSDFERGDKALLSAKYNRSTIEYFFTCTPSLPLYILNNYPEVDTITYLDADLYFFSSPIVLYEEMGSASIAIIGHRFPPAMRYKEKNGIYNVGYLTFRRDKYALECLKWWRERCIEWCYDRIESNCYADQKYLDDWPTRFKNVKVLNNKGANLAPWNIANYSVTSNELDLFVDEQPLVFYHFHGLKKLIGNIYDPNLSGYKVTPHQKSVRNIYIYYIKELRNVQKILAPASKTASLHQGIRVKSSKSRYSSFPLFSIAKKIVNSLRFCKRFFNREYILYFNK